MNTFDVFVKAGPDVKTVQFKVPRPMLEYTIGMGGKVVNEVRILAQLINYSTCFISCTSNQQQIYGMRVFILISFLVYWQVANDTNTRITIVKPKAGEKHIVFSITGKLKDVKEAQYIFKEIVKSNIHKSNMARPFTNS